MIGQRLSAELGTSDVRLCTAAIPSAERTGGRGSEAVEWELYAKGWPEMFGMA